MSPNRFSGLAALALLALLLSALHMMSDAVQGAGQAGEWFVPLLLVTVAGLALLLLLVAISFWGLLQRYRLRVAGSRLALRLVLLFGALSLVPVGVVYFYSLQFLLHGVDSWFDVQIDRAMEDSLELSRASLDLHKRKSLTQTERILAQVEDVSETALAFSLGELRASSGAIELTLMDHSGRVLATSHESTQVLVTDRPDSSVLLRVRGGDNYVDIAPQGETDRVRIRVVVTDPLGRPWLLQAIYPTSERIAALIETVQTAYVGYKERAYLRRSIKFSFALTLSLVMTFSTFAAIWMALVTARRLVAPVAGIAAGTRAVAEGDYSTQLPVPPVQDELSFLVSSFNAMTRRIGQARDQAETSQRQLAAQHAYLETVLGRLSSGVIALDEHGRLHTANKAARDILRIPIDYCLDKPIKALIEASAQLLPLVELVERHNPRADWRAEVTLYRGEGRQVLLAGGSPMILESGRELGRVLVFDDITKLVLAQRNAAWGEVARRLAHEIKNPLTPIKLSAERLRRRYLGKLGEDDKVMDKATHTIVQQVDAMKAMVDAFSDYAKPSKLAAEPLALDQFVDDVLDLYQVAGQPIAFDRAAPGACVEADPVRLRQVLHNLVKNALEAVSAKADGEVTVTSQIGEQNDVWFAELQVSDNGPGFSMDDLGQVFEPYVTTKGKGTGLGLAIVKKIIEEHGGMVSAENRGGGGARVTLRLPTVKKEHNNRSCT